MHSHRLCHDLFIFAFVVLAAQRSEAMEFTILVHPGAGIKADTVKSILLESLASRGGEARSILGQNVSKAGSREASDLKNLGEQQGLFLFFEAPTAVPATKRIKGSLNSQPETWHTYLSVTSVQPYSLWLRINGKDAPVLLGRGVIWGEASQLTDGKERSSSGILIFSLSSETTAQLHVRALRLALRDFQKIYEQTLGLQIFVAKGVPNITSDGLIATAKNLAAISMVQPRPLNFQSERIPSYEEFKVTFPISRFKKQPDGTYQVEADLWNRLPMAVHGSLHRHPTRIESATVKRNYSDDMVNFDLKPGEKKTVAFKVESHPNLTAAMLQSNAIVVDWVELGERKLDKDEMPNKTKKKKK